jgi:hypothetical protein
MLDGEEDKAMWIFLPPSMELRICCPSAVVVGNSAVSYSLLMLVMTHQYGGMVCCLDSLASFVILNCLLCINMVVWYVCSIHLLHMLAQFACFGKRDRSDNRTGIAV